MKIIDTLKSRFRNNSPDATPMAVALVVMLAGTILFGLLAQAVRQQSSNDYQNRMDRQVAALSVHTSNAVRSYNKLLISAAAAVNVRQDVSAGFWERLYRDMKVAEQYPETIGFGYATYHSEAQRTAFEELTRQTYREDFTVRPATGQDTYTTITYIQPMDEQNTTAIGYSMYSEQLRRKAIETARDTATVTLTAPVKLVQDRAERNGSRYGVLMYFPVYEGGVTPSSVDERRAKAKGFVYLALRPGDLVQHYIETTPQFANEVNIRVRDKTSNTALYELNSSKGDAGVTTKSVKENFNGRDWVFEVAGHEPFIASTTGPISIVVLGLFTSIAGSVATYRLLKVRVGRIKKAYADEVQRSKEELLALASHQLRTPASGVKQYLGLLHGGFVGELSERQKEVTEKAMVANERQLKIINELLYVSKIDAGQLQLDKHEVDITSLVRSVVEGFEDQSARKGIRLQLATKRSHKAEVDEDYIRMIVENLVSNAIKYSYEQSVVKATVRRAGDNIEVSIRDNGVGVSDGDKMRIFQKFERVKNDMSRVEGGSGLGLFLAKELALAHGGDITVESAEGRGTTFTVSLPIGEGV